MASGGIQGDMTGGAPEDRALSATRDPGEAGVHSVTSLGGIAAIAGAIFAIAGNAVVLAAHPSAPSDVVSYPLSAHDFRLGQIFFALTQALMALGIVALARSGVAGRGRQARAGAYLAVVGYAITIPGELVLAFVATDLSDSGRASAASSVFGIGVLLAAVGLILFGSAALRAAVWPKCWAALPVVLGVFQLLVVTPVAMAAGFASVAAFVAITVQDLLLALLGFRLVAQNRLSA